MRGLGRLNARCGVVGQDRATGRRARGRDDPGVAAFVRIHVRAELDFPAASPFFTRIGTLA